MSMTDPVADFLTRDPQRDPGVARDGRDPGVASSSARWPASCASRATSTRCELEAPNADHPGEPHPHQAQVHRADRRSAISGLQRVSRPGQRNYVGHGEIPKVLGGMGTAIVSTSQRRDDRPRGPPRGRRRRGRRGGLVAHHVPNRHASPSPCPPASPSRSSPSSCASTARAASSPSASTRDIERRRRRTGRSLVTRPTDRGEHRALHGLTRSLVANMVEGVTDGFTKTLEIQGVGYRAVLKGRDLELALGYSHPVPIKAPDGIEFEVPQPTRIIVKGNSQAAGRRDRRQHPQAAAAGALQGQGHPLRGRVRRPEGRQARMSVITKPQRAAQAPPPRPREGRRHRRAPAHLGVPLQPRHLRPARRRRRRPHAGGRVSGPRPTCATSSRWSRPPRPASCSPSARRPPASSAPCSTAAATSTTDASRRSPRASAREDSTV